MDSVSGKVANGRKTRIIRKIRKVLVKRIVKKRKPPLAVPKDNGPCPGESSRKCPEESRGSGEEASDPAVPDSSLTPGERNVVGVGVAGSSSPRVRVNAGSTQTSSGSQPSSTEGSSSSGPMAFAVRVHQLGTRADVQKDVRYLVPQDEEEYLQLLGRYLEVHSLKGWYKVGDSRLLLGAILGTKDAGDSGRGDSPPNGSGRVGRSPVLGLWLPSRSAPGGASRTAFAEPVKLRILGSLLRSPRGGWGGHRSLQSLLKKRKRDFVLSSEGAGGVTVRLNLRQSGGPKGRAWPYVDWVGRSLVKSNNEKRRMRTGSSLKPGSKKGRREGEGQTKGKGRKCGGGGNRGQQPRISRAALEIKELIYTT